MIKGMKQVSANSFQIGTKHGRISGRIPLSQLDASTATVLAVDDVPDGDISLREAARREWRHRPGLPPVLV